MESNDNIFSCSCLSEVTFLLLLEEDVDLSNFSSSTTLQLQILELPFIVTIQLPKTWLQTFLKIISPNFCLDPFFSFAHPVFVPVTWIPLTKISPPIGFSLVGSLSWLIQSFQGPRFPSTTCVSRILHSSANWSLHISRPVLLPSSAFPVSLLDINCK